MPKVSIQTAPSYSWGDQCLSWRLLDSTNLSVKQELMPPHTAETLHFHHQATQFFYVLSGSATFLINGQKELVQSGEGIQINPGTAHQIANDSEEDLKFLVISQPSADNDRKVVTDP